MTGQYRLAKAIQNLEDRKSNNDNLIPGILGIIINGLQTVDVSGRDGFVYVRVRDNQSELVQAYNDVVSPVYGLPVLIVRDVVYPGRYRVVERDLARYDTWQSSFVPKHGNQHSFAGANGSGGDVVWVYGRQFMPLLVHPSGAFGAANVVIEPGTLYWDNSWNYAGGTGSVSLTQYNPSGGFSRMVLIYLDENLNPTALAGQYFNPSYTGTSDIIQYVPAMPPTASAALAAVRLTSGTSTIGWDNIYDLRPLIVGETFSTGTFSGHIIQDEGTPLTNRPSLNFQGSNIWAVDNLALDRTDIIVSGSAAIFASLAEAEAGVITNKVISPSTLNFREINSALIRQLGYGGNTRGFAAVDLQIDRGSVGNVAAGNNSEVLGGYANTAIGDYAQALGGNSSYSSGSYASIVGGQNNVNTAWHSFIGGGDTNKLRPKDANSQYLVLVGGVNNTILGEFVDASVIVGGSVNTIKNGGYNFIGGGASNNIYQSIDRASTDFLQESVISGGDSNTISGSYATIPGGSANEVWGDYGYAAGRRAKSKHQGSFVLTDSSNFDFSSTGTNQYRARFVGGFRFASAINGSGVEIYSGTFDISNNQFRFGGDGYVSGTFNSNRINVSSLFVNNLPVIPPFFNGYVSGTTTGQPLIWNTLSGTYIPSSLLLINNTTGTSYNAFGSLSVSGSSYVNGSLYGGGVIQTNGYNVFTIPGSGTAALQTALAAGQIAYGSSATTITSSSLLTWNAATNRMGVGRAATTYPFEIEAAADTRILSFYSGVTILGDAISVANASAVIAGARWRIRATGGNVWGFGAQSLQTTNNVYFLNESTAQIAFYVTADSPPRLGIGHGNVAPARTLHTYISDAVINAVSYTSRQDHVSTGVTTGSFGVGQEWFGEDSDGTSKLMATDEVIYTATGATRKVKRDFPLSDFNATRVPFTLQAYGSGSYASMNGGMVWHTVTKSADYLITPNDIQIFFISTANAYLPPAIQSNNVYRVVAGTGTSVIIYPYGTDTIYGAATKTLNPGEYALISDVGSGTWG